MLLKINSVKNKDLKRFLEHSLYLAILLVLIPAFLYFELCIVLPATVEEWSTAYFVHLFCAAFLLINILGNLIYGAFTDTSIKGRFIDSINKKNWSMCVVCECLQPPRAWHCEICNVCILKRDHHCSFFACCVGYFNHRYFIMLTFYIFIAMVYAFYYNTQFIAQFLSWNNGFIIIKFLFPIASIVIDFGSETIYIFLLIINTLIGLFSGFLFFYHFRNVLYGQIVPDIKHNTKELYNKGWKLNLIEVFGIRWYWTWILPFIHSPLPGNGFEWIVGEKYE